MQVSLARALWAHLARILDTAEGLTPSGWRRLEEDLGAPLQVRAKDPYLFPAARAGEWVRGSVLLHLEVLGAAPRPAWLAVDQALCAALGRAPEELLAAAREALTGAPVRAIAAIPSEDPTALAAVAALGGRGGMSFALDLSVTCPGRSCWARLLCGADLRLLAPPPLRREALARRWARRKRLSHAAVTLAMEAGHGLLSARALSELQEGDVVVLDRFGPRPVVGGPVWLRLGRGAFPSRLDGEGITIEGAYQIEGTTMAEVETGDDPSKTSKDHEDGPRGTQLLEEMPVPVVCEIGRITLTGAQVLELRAGVVLPVGRPLAGPVDLTIGGRVIAHGELVDVEGEIGVRVTEVLG
jgi:type III secretion system YscQ/HrcQ family protein